MKNFFIYFIFIVITVFWMVMGHDPAFVILFIFELVLLLCSMASLYLMRRKVQVTLDRQAWTAVKGEIILFQFSLNNSGFFPIPFYTIKGTYRNTFSKKKETFQIKGSMKRKGITKVECKLLSEYTGNLELNLVSIRCFDFLQLFSFKRKLKIKNNILVLPQIYPTEITKSVFLADSTGDSEIYSDEKSGDDPSQIFDIREYRPGDKMQNIHWKLTAKRDKLISKENSLPLGFHVTILAELSPPFKPKDALHQMDIFFTTLASVSYSLLEKDIYHYIAWYDQESGTITREPIEQLDDIHACLHHLIQTNYDKHADNLTDLYQETFEESRQEQLLMIDNSTKITFKHKQYQLDSANIQRSLARLQLV